MAAFKIPPISTLIGSTLPNFIRVLRNHKIDRKYILNLVLSSILVLLFTPFHIIEYIYFKIKLRKYILKKPPIFIIGHWRSGTTFLHNTIAQDERLGYFTTYNSVFPNNLLSKIVVKPLMKWTMPDRRPADNLKLGVDLPQEDEFALGNFYDLSYYNFFYFPNDYTSLYEKAVRFGVPKKRQLKWRSKYDILLKKALLNTKGDQILVKNPVNTARIKELLTIYPNAKFIHIHRNPVFVYLSTLNFFSGVLPSLQLQKISTEEVNNLIITTYKKLYHDFYAQKHLIPSSQLIEIEYEQFVQSPLDHIEKIYTKLDIEGFSSAKQILKTYVDSKSSHRINTYTIDKKVLDRVLKEWDFAFQAMNYSVPDNIEITL